MASFLTICQVRPIVLIPEDFHSNVDLSLCMKMFLIKFGLNFALLHIQKYDFRKYNIQKLTKTKPKTLHWLSQQGMPFRT